MAKFLALLVIFSLVGCSFKKDVNEQTTENAIFKGVKFDSSGLSQEKVQLGIKLQRDKNGMNTYYLATATEDEIKILCAFTNYDLPLAQDIVHKARQSVTIVLRDAPVLETEDDQNTNIQDIFISLNEKVSISNKTSEQLMNDPKTLVYIRALDINNKDSAQNIFCEFSLVTP